MNQGLRESRPSPHSESKWLVGGGRMGEFIKAKDWSRTPLGAIDTWPQSLRTTVSLVLASNSPISLAWGPGHIQIYNDGYWPICGEKHPESMGQDFRECWASAFPVIGDAYATAWRGRSAYLEKMRMFLDRYGFLEETWFTFSFSPITDETGEVGGLFHPVTEMTPQMLSERRTRVLRDLASRTADARTSSDAFLRATQILGEAQFDIPFALLYELQTDGLAARLAASTGLPANGNLAPARIEVATGHQLWPIAQVLKGGTAMALVENLERHLQGISVGPYPEPPHRAVVMPLAGRGVDAPLGVIIAGISPRLHFDDAYRDFVGLTATAVSSAWANARAYEEAKERAEALAEIDRAKTTFFTNISHEFRTPLTLILGPVEDAVTAAEPRLDGQGLHAVHRNALRLLRLVNTLLDFSRLEAGRLETSFEPVDLAALTSALASSFQSLIESNGLQLVIDCPPLRQPVFVDRAHWEKIVLNLVSNAFKFTFTGAITVRLRDAGTMAELSVADTGTGIPEPELAHVFDRFHRVKNARGRSFEGSGIGLALVKDLVERHGGSIRAASVAGSGTTFTVEIPFGSVHLNADELPGSRADADGAPLRSQYVLEATRWRPAAEPGGVEPARALADRDRGRVLIVDDSHDMREYIAGLLRPEFEVEMCGDGDAAFLRICESPPDLVLSDVMMPGLDGFGLLKAIRANAPTHTMPVVLLSARAGEEAVVQGLERGADDYLVKPFSARELLSRVRTHLELSRLRRQAHRAAEELAATRAQLLADLERKNQELEAFSYSVSHDLRAPLRSIDGFSQALLEDCGHLLSAEGQRYLQRVRLSAARMGALIDALIQLSRVERAELRRTAVDITQLARRVVELLARNEPHRSVHVSIAENLVAHADARLAEIVLENVLGNAWKFTSRTDAPTIELFATRNGSATVFAVRDNGAGFDQATANRLFTPFQRLHEENDFPGTGIGLATVRRIVDRHGGKVWAESAPGRGATFYWTFSRDAEESAS